MKIQKILAISGILLIACSVHAKRYLKNADDQVTIVGTETKNSKKQSKKVAKKEQVKKKSNAKFAHNKIHITNKKKVAKKINKKSSVKVTYSPKRQARFAGFYSDLEYGVIQYHKKSSALITVYDYVVNRARDLPNNIDIEDTSHARIVMDHSKPVLCLGYQAGLEFENLPMFQKDKKAHAHIGVATSIAKRKDAVTGSWYAKGATTTNLITKQDVKRFEGLVVGDYDVFEYYGLVYKIDGALGVAVGNLRDIRIYEKSGEKLYDTGEIVPHKKLSFIGKLGLSFEKQFDVFSLGFGYRAGFSQQEYENYMLLKKPDANASNSFQNNYQNLRAASAYKLLKFIPPVFKLFSYEFRFTLGWNF